MKLYPPKGGFPIIPHPTKIEYYLARGWTEKPKTVKSKTVKKKED